MLPDDASHATCVTAWLEPIAKGLPPAQLVALFERALDALWQRTRLTLGEVTLTAIVDRVLYTASEKYPFLSALKIEGTGIRFDEFRQLGPVLHDRHLPDVVRFVLVELLTVLGNLTDEILTPALHAQLSKVALEEPRRTGKETRDEPEGATS
jgi:hypothetical protein